LTGFNHIQWCRVILC